MSVLNLIAKTKGKDLVGKFDSCGHCKKQSTNLHVCSCCYETAYCGVECQKAHRGKHVTLIEGVIVEFKGVKLNVPNDVFNIISKWLDADDLKNLRLVNKDMNQAIRRLLFERSVFDLTTIDRSLLKYILTNERTNVLKDLVFDDDKEFDEWQMTIRLKGYINRVLNVMMMCKKIRVNTKNELELLKKWRQYLKFTHLETDRYFSGEGLDMSGNTLPSTLTHLKFGYYFNQNIENILPPNLKQLTFGYTFNQPVKNLLPNGLTHLTFGTMFNQDIHNGLPSSLKFLMFELEFHN